MGSGRRPKRMLYGKDAKPGKPLGQATKHEFHRDENDPNYTKTACVECGHDRRNPIHL